MVPDDATVRCKAGKPRAGDFEALCDRKVSRGVDRPGLSACKSDPAGSRRASPAGRSWQESGGCLRGIDPDDVHLVGSAVGHVEQVVWTESKGPNMLYRFWGGDGGLTILARDGDRSVLVGDPKISKRVDCQGVGIVDLEGPERRTRFPCRRRALFPNCGSRSACWASRSPSQRKAIRAQGVGGPFKIDEETLLACFNRHLQQINRKRSCQLFRCGQW